MTVRPHHLQGALDALHERLVAAVRAHSPPWLAVNAEDIARRVVADIQDPPDPISLSKLGYTRCIEELRRRRRDRGLAGGSRARAALIPELGVLPRALRHAAILRYLGHGSADVRSLLGEPITFELPVPPAQGRERLTEAGFAAVPQVDCPAPEAIWLAALGEAPQSLPQVLDHLGACGCCVEAWRVVTALTSVSTGEAEVIPLFPNGPPDGSPYVRRELATPDSALRSSELPTPRRAMLWGLAGAACLAALMSLVIAPTYLREPPPAWKPVLRSLPATASPSEALRLEWTPGPEGCSYALRLYDDRDRAVYQAVRLREPAHEVPATTWAELAPGDRVTIRIDTRAPSGASATSDPQVVVVGAAEAEPDG